MASVHFPTPEELGWYSGWQPDDDPLEPFKRIKEEELRMKQKSTNNNNKPYSPEGLLNFYNSNTTGPKIEQDSETMAIINTALKRADNDPVYVKNHIRSWIKEYKNAPYDLSPWDAFQACFESLEPPKKGVDESMNILEKAVVQLINKEQSEKISKAVMGSVEDKVRDFIKSEYGVIERKCITVVDGKKTELEGVVHEKFDTVLKFVANKEPVFLTGPAGSGKNFLCKQVAKALGLDFYFTNAVTQEYKLTGFTDAMGNFQETQFYKAFTQGGLFMLDEIDASIPEVLIILNAAIANGYFDFPAPIGYKEAHPDFRVIAAGNTVGQGADYIYCGRNQLDAASLDRFAIVPIFYSPVIERYCANEDDDLLAFCRDFRKIANENGQNIVVSYRGISRLSKMIKLLDIKEALKTCLLKGIEKDDLNIISKNLSVDGAYSKALQDIVASM